MNREGKLSLYRRPGCEVCHSFKRLQVLGPAIRISAVINGICSYIYMLSFQDLCPCQRKGEEYGVAGRHVGDRDWDG